MHTHPIWKHAQPLCAFMSPKPRYFSVMSHSGKRNLFLYFQISPHFQRISDICLIVQFDHSPSVTMSSQVTCWQDPMHAAHVGNRSFWCSRCKAPWEQGRRPTVRNHWSLVFAALVVFNMYMFLPQADNHHRPFIHPTLLPHLHIM